MCLDYRWVLPSLQQTWWIKGSIHRVSNVTLSQKNTIMKRTLLIHIYSFPLILVANSPSSDLNADFTAESIWWYIFTLIQWFFSDDVPNKPKIHHTKKTVVLVEGKELNWNWSYLIIHTGRDTKIRNLLFGLFWFEQVPEICSNVPESALF